MRRASTVLSTIGLLALAVAIVSMPGSDGLRWGLLGMGLLVAAACFIGAWWLGRRS